MDRQNAIVERRKLWQSVQVDLALVEQISRTQGLPTRVVKWMLARGHEPDGLIGWLSPETTEWTNPSWFHDLPAAVTRIMRAVENQETIVIVGDYDVDGVTATAILAEALQAIGAHCEVLIPHRIEDGYGLSVTLAERAQELGVALLITVDNGIQAHDAVDWCNERGIDVIVTDHHEPGVILPSTYATVHYVQSTSPDELKRLSGAGVSWKLAQTLVRQYQAEDLSIPDADLHLWQNWLQALAALGAMADMMPMVGENRRLVREGLTTLRLSYQPGWVALCSLADVNPGKLDDTTVLWKITPRLNAAGRIGDAMIAYRLLRERDETQAEVLARALEDYNEQRRMATTTAITYAEQLLSQGAPSDQSHSGAYVLAIPCSIGIAGIVAARVTEITGRPAIILADDGGELLKGSGRAPNGFPLRDALVECESLLHQFGGHDAAVGLAIQRVNLEAFSSQLAGLASRWLQSEASRNEDEMSADDYLALQDITPELLTWIDKLGPFGTDNPTLTFYIGPVVLDGVTPLSDGRHLRLRVREGKDMMQIIWFQVPEEARKLQTGMSVEALVYVERHEWQGRERIQLRALAVKPLFGALTRDEFVYLYKLLRSRRTLHENDLRTVSGMTGDKLKVMLSTFVELGFARQEESAYHVVEQAPYRDLREARAYHQHLCGLGVKGATI